MTAQLPASTLDLFERPILCALSTINPDGQPHTVPVWCDRDGDTVADSRDQCPDQAGSVAAAGCPDMHPKRR